MACGASQVILPPVLVVQQVKLPFYDQYLTIYRTYDRIELQGQMQSAMLMNVPSEEHKKMFKSGL